MSTAQISTALHQEIAYPEQMAAVECGILGDGFYPGARGYSGLAFPHGGVMLLGRDFGTLDYYERMIGKRSETALTWRHTRDIYLETLQGFPVWCTNYLMGVRRNGSAKGNVRDQIETQAWVRYEESCWRFLQRQLALQQPSVLAVFGEFNEADLRRADRLESPQVHATTVLYLKHPHSAIGAANRAVHIRQAVAIREALKHS